MTAQRPLFRPRSACRRPSSSTATPACPGVACGRCAAIRPSPVVPGRRPLCLDLRLEPIPTAGAIAVHGQLADRRDPLKGLGGSAVLLLEGERVAGLDVRQPQWRVRVRGPHRGRVFGSVCRSPTAVGSRSRSILCSRPARAARQRSARCVACAAPPSRGLPRSRLSLVSPPPSLPTTPRFSSCAPIAASSSAPPRATS